MDRQANFVVLESVLSKKTLLNTALVWLFVTFVAACAFMQDKQKEPYPLGDFVKFLTVTTLFFSLWGYVKYSLRINLTLTTELLIISSVFKVPRRSYRLTDMIDFSWSSKPYNASSKFGSVRLRKEHFEITFSNGDFIKIQGDEFENYNEFQKHLYFYCKKNNVSINGSHRLKHN